MTRHEIRAAIDDLQTFSNTGLTSGELASVNRALGLFYEAYAQAILSAHEGESISGLYDRY